MDKWDEIESACRMAIGTALKGFGIDTVALEADPFESEATVGWLELTTGPIRWIEIECWDWDVSGPPDVRMGCFVPDPRVTSLSAGVGVEPVLIRTFPLFGRVKAAKWKARKWGGLPPKRFSLRLADYLGHDTGLSGTILTAEQTSRHPCPDSVEVVHDIPCWLISGEDLSGGGDSIKPVWDCYVAIAEALLKMPIP